MRKFRLLLVLGLLLSTLFISCSSTPKASKNDICIIYTNDIHSYIANTTKDADKNVVPALRLSNISQMAKDLQNEGKTVFIVDAGDAIQGTVYGSIDKGETIINLMNAVGYQIAVPGNHEFDYGTDNFFKLKSMANHTYLCCNLNILDSSVSKNEMEAVKILNAGNKKIAFIGITTPETITHSTPVFFQNKEGKFLYDFDGSANCEDLYSKVQETINSVRDSVDYVIVIGHTGVGFEEKRLKISSEDIIKNTTGIDAFIDAHSHTIMEQNLVKNKNKKEVLLTQTGYFLHNVGLMTIDSKGQISTKLVNEYSGSDSAVVEMEEAVISEVNNQFNVKIATLETELAINNPNNAKQRLIRSREMNSGDFTADAFYWYFNEVKQIDCDISIHNGGGIRNVIKAGDITTNDVKAMSPFENQVCLVSTTGQNILDALECGATVIGIWDKEWNSPAENGGFLHVAGMKYTIDCSTQTSVVLDGQQMFKEVAGAYRVKDVQIYNKKTHTYEPLDVNKTYTIGGINYLLRNGGNGLSMFTDSQMIVDYVGEDANIISDYIKSFKKDGEYPLVKSENSVLSKYENYLLDYENPYGAGRIIIK